jgi:hypothetical protein
MRLKALRVSEVHGMAADQGEGVTKTSCHVAASTMAAMMTVSSSLIRCAIFRKADKISQAFL